MVTVCDVDGVEFETNRKNARFCSDACRQKARRRRKSGLPENVVQLGVVPEAPDLEHGPVYTASMAELVEAERQNTTLGRAALALAARIDQGVDTGSGLASAVKTLGDTMAAATKGARRAATPLDRVREARDAKRAGG